MQLPIRLLSVLASATLCAATGDKLEVTPVQKVIKLLGGMLEKGKKAKHEEQVLFAASKQFCDDTEATKQVAIKEGSRTIEGLEAAVAKDTADAAHLLKKVSHLNEDEDTWSGDIKAATKVRDIEKADYDKMHEDYSQSIVALQNAIAVLKKQSHDRSQKSSLAQVTRLKSLKLITDKAKKAIDLFLQQGQYASEEQDLSDLSTGAPEANPYEFQASGVIDMLEKLLDKFVDEKTNLEKSETNAKNAYSLLMQDLKAQIAQAIKEHQAKQLSRTMRLQSKADKSADLKTETATKAADEKYLKELQASCQMKASEFEARQQLRAEEISTIEGAIETLSSAAVSGNAKKHLPSLSQLRRKGSSLGQLRSNSNTKIQERVVQFLRARAAKLNSRVLAAVARRVEADPFAKVKKIIKDLVVRLMEEANEEAEHKGWCDTELATNEQTRKEKTAAVEVLHAEIDEIEASLAKLKEDINGLTAAVADLDKAIAQATKIRAEEKGKNTDTISDAQDAQTAVAQALIVLKEFYAKAAAASSLLEVKAVKPYRGMQDENGGVVGLLEVIESDFARLESETKAAEVSAQKEYDTFISDSKVDKASKSKDMDHKVSKKQDESQALVSKKDDLEGTQKSLNSALAYFEKLKPSCVDSGVSYEDRVARRKDEIESLQEALKVLNGEDIAM